MHVMFENSDSFEMPCNLMIFDVDKLDEIACCGKTSFFSNTFSMYFRVRGLG